MDRHSGSTMRHDNTSLYLGPQTVAELAKIESIYKDDIQRKDQELVRTQNTIRLLKKENAKLKQTMQHFSERQEEQHRRQDIQTLARQNDSALIEDLRSKAVAFEATARKSKARVQEMKQTSKVTEERNSELVDMIKTCESMMDELTRGKDENAEAQKDNERLKEELQYLRDMQDEAQTLMKERERERNGDVKIIMKQLAEEKRAHDETLKQLVQKSAELDGFIEREKSAEDDRRRKAQESSPDRPSPDHVVTTEESQNRCFWCERSLIAPYFRSGGKKICMASTPVLAPFRSPLLSLRNTMPMRFQIASRVYKGLSSPPPNSARHNVSFGP